MNADEAHGVFLNALTETERAALAAIMGFLTIPVISLVFIDTIVYRTAAALLAFVIAVPTWWFALTTARNIYREHGYLRIDRGLMVAAGAIPISVSLLYIVGQGAAESPALSIALAVVLTAVMLIVTYKAIDNVIDGDEVHYRLEGDWLAYYSDSDAVERAHEAHDIDRDTNLNFNTLYLLLFIELALLLNINLTATTPREQAFAFVLSAVSILVPFLAIVGLRTVEYDEYNETTKQLLTRLVPPFVYGFTAVFMFATIVYAINLTTALLVAGLAFVPFFLFTFVILWLYKPSLFENTPIPESPT